MAYTTIDDPSAYFQVATWTGDGSTSDRNITNDGNSDLAPDFIWGACRSNVQHKHLTDSSRGFSTGNKELISNSTNVEGDTNAVNTGAYGWLGPSITDGFVSNYGSVNNGYWNVNARTYVAWQWKCNGGTTSNLSGNLASVVQVNADAGFSIVKYTGSGGNGQSVLHGLGLTPEVIITKAINGVNDWYVYHKSIGNTKILKLNTTDAEATSSVYNAAAVSSSAFFVSTNLIYVGQLGADYVSYCFAPIQGYSKFGSYTGNGNASGPFIYTGFKPAFFLIKKTSAADGWRLFDNKRAGYNDDNYRLAPNSTDAEDKSTTYLDMLSNGVKIRGTAGSFNQSGGTFIYMAFAENPFVTSTGTPTTAI